MKADSSLHRCRVSSCITMAVCIFMATVLPRAVWPSEIDCEKANTTIEVAVCGDETLMAADKKVSGLVQHVGQFEPRADVDQKEWQEHTRDQCADSDCLSSAYLDRIGALQEIIRVRDEAAVASASTSSIPTDSAGGVSTAQPGDDIAPFQPTQAQPGLQDVQNHGEDHSQGEVVLWAILGVFALILIIGSTGSAVICIGIGDLFLTMAPYVIAVVGWMAYGMQDVAPTGQTEGQILVVVVTSFAITLAVIKNFHNATIFNRSLSIGLMIGILRLIVGLFSLVIIIGAMWGGGSDSQNDNPPKDQGLHRLIVFVFIGLAIWFFWAIVNGRRVYEARGWLEDTE